MTNEKIIQSRIIKILIVLLLVSMAIITVWNKAEISSKEVNLKYYNAGDFAGISFCNASGEILELVPNPVEISAGATKMVTIDNETAFSLESSSRNELFVSAVNTSTKLIWKIVARQNNNYQTAGKSYTLTVKNTAGEVIQTIDVNVPLVATGMHITDEAGQTVSTVAMDAYSSARFVAVPVPENASVASVRWSSSDTSVATVDATTGVVTAGNVTGSNATITASGGSVSASFMVSVNANPIQSISLDKTNVDLAAGESVKLNIITEPENGTITKAQASQNPTWTSSNPSAVSVDSEGNVTGESNGSARITVSYLGKTATANVEVSVSATGMNITDTEMEVNLGESKKPNVVFEPTTSSQNLAQANWSSADETIATVDNTGAITGVKVGQTTITGTLKSNPSIKDTIVVNVKAPITGIEFASPSVEVGIGQKTTVGLNYIPENTTDQKQVVLTSADPTVATAALDANGNVVVTGVALGNTTITARNELRDVSATLDVTVKEIKLDEIVISNKITEGMEGEKYNLEVLFSPENTTDDRTITWSSSNETVARVVNGRLELLTPGEATITATAVGNKTDSFTITVKKNDIKSIEIQAESYQLEVGKAVALNVVFNPSNTTSSRDIEFTSSDENVITVDNSGLVIAVGTGKATITAKTVNGVTATKEFTVVEAKQQGRPSSSPVTGGTNSRKLASPQTSDMNVKGYQALTVISFIGIVVLVNIIKKRHN